MKIIKSAAFLLSLSLLVPSAADRGSVYNWYFKAGEDGGRPMVFGGSTMPDKYGTIYLGNPDDKVIYLTFDAGYGCESLDNILETLKEEDVKASFFILPALVKYALPTVKRMEEDGHLIANHTYSHKNLSRVTDIEELKKELTDLEDYCRAEAGIEIAKFVRPPEGAFTEQTLAFCRELGYTPVFWSFAYADWDERKQPDPESAKQKILKNAHNGEVMLLHPNSRTNAAILGDVIKELKNRGYSFKTLDGFDKAAMSTELYEKLNGKGLLYSGNAEKEDCIALTFDDGPHAKLTDEILGILDGYGAKATFFMIGENVEQNPEVARRVLAAGHEVGNHTYSHRKASSMSVPELESEIKKAEDVFLRELNYRPKLFRPPAGDIDEAGMEAAAALGFTGVLWRVDTRDWAHPSVQQIVNTVKRGVKGGDIVLFHDYISGESPTPQALRELLPYLTERYKLVTVSELIS